MYIFVISLMIFVAFLLVVVILAQNSKGGGLTSQFGGSTASNIIGVKKTGDLLEKLTWSLVVVIMALALSTNLINPSATAGSGNEIFDKANQSAPANPGALDPGTTDTTTSPTPADTAP
jgi:preprotein translocase subunit SecG